MQINTLVKIKNSLLSNLNQNTTQYNTTLLFFNLSLFALSFTLGFFVCSNVEELRNLLRAFRDSLRALNNVVADSDSIPNRIQCLSFTSSRPQLIDVGSVTILQATMPSNEKHPSHVPMWKGVKVAYALIAAGLFPLAIGGFWAYGQLIPANGGMLTALCQFHSRGVSRFVLGLTSMFIVVNGLCSFQIYGMPLFDDLESKYTRRMKKPCPWWLRIIIRLFVGFISFFVAAAIPFLSSLAGLTGGIALPVTLAYPCFMWLKVKKPKKCSVMWCLNWFLGTLGMALSAILVAASIYIIVDTGVKVTFFNPQ